MKLAYSPFDIYVLCIKGYKTLKEKGKESNENYMNYMPKKYLLILSVDNHRQMFWEEVISWPVIKIALPLGAKLTAPHTKRWTWQFPAK